VRLVVKKIRQKFRTLWRRVGGSKEKPLVRMTKGMTGVKAKSRRGAFASINCSRVLSNGKLKNQGLAGEIKGLRNQKKKKRLSIRQKGEINCVGR